MMFPTNQPEQQSIFKSVFQMTAVLCLSLLMILGVLQSVRITDAAPMAARQAVENQTQASFLDTQPSWAIQGAHYGDELGYMAQIVGDLNGDGYDDAVVNTGWDAFGTAGPNRVYLFFGSEAGLDDTPSMILMELKSSTGFGYSVAGSGDVNGDGYDDLLISAPATGTDGQYLGGVYVYYGDSSSITATPAFTLTGENPGDGFGTAIAIPGDLNDDGFDDVVVGARGNDETGNNAGKVYVYLGSDIGLTNTPVFTETGLNEEEEFGSAVSAVGDVNGDDVVDFAVSAPSGDGRVNIFADNGSGIQATPILTLTGETSGQKFGYSIHGGGDVNGDSYADIVISERWYGDPIVGRVYVYQGSIGGLSTTPDSVLTGTTVAEGFGDVVRMVGDVDGDGYDDVAISVYYADDGAGRVMIYPGSATGLVTLPAFLATGQDAYLAPDNYRELFGSAIGSGDVNGDGRSDVIVGAYATRVDGDIYTGRAYLFSQHPVIENLQPDFVTVADGNWKLGSDVMMGDINGDGFDDAIFSDFLWNDGTGRVYIHCGSDTGLNTTADTVLEGQSSGDAFGWPLALADVNGDGYDDVLASETDILTGSGTNYIHVYHGSPSGLSATPNLTLVDSDYGDRFGWSLASAGDVNGDNYDDVLIGAVGNDSGASGAGQAYLYSGTAVGLSPTPVFTWTGTTYLEGLGSLVSSSGDLNGDGYDEVAIGNRIGHVAIYPGSGGGVQTTALLSLDSFATQVTSGDINGDNYDDLIIGESDYETNSGPVGQIAVYHGGAGTISQTPTFTITGKPAQEAFGHAVSYAGDINDDGYGDIFVGAYLGDKGQTNGGRVLVYTGSDVGLADVPSLEIVGEELWQQFGYDIAKGDIDGDGLTDLLVGAVGHQENDIVVGQVQAYYSLTISEGPWQIFLPALLR